MARGRVTSSAVACAPQIQTTYRLPSQVNPQKCRDTAPVTAADPVYPYVGKYIKDLTLAQIKTMDCGYQQLPGFPEEERVRVFEEIHASGIEDQVALAGMRSSSSILVMLAMSGRR